jgi:Tol biopolymer transport system component
MNRYDAFERELTAWFIDTAAPRTPDYATDIVQMTATQRQRPRWTFPERWLPMSVITLVPRSARPAPWRMLGMLAALALLVAIAVVAYVGSQNRLPAPFGLASNGLVAYTQNGDILTVDPGTGTRAWITSGNEEDREARWSLDGTRLAFLRGLPLGTPTPVMPAETVVIVDRAGKVVAKSAPIARIDIDAFAWSPDGKSLAVGGDSVLSVVDAKDGDVTRLEVGYTDLDVYWRPGDGHEILFHGITRDGGRGLVVVDVDDPADARLLVPESNDETLRPNGWTPDGQRLIYTSVDEPYAETGAGLRLHVLDITTGSHVVIEAGHGHVSNDGSRILALNAEGPCVVSIEGGHCDLIAPSSRAYEGGFASGVHWAPDDAWILVRDPAQPGRAFLLDPSGDSQESPAWPESGGESWQRRAR